MALFFAQARDIVGHDSMMLDLPSPATVADAVDAVVQAHPRLEVMRNRLAVAVDEHYARPEALLHDGCTVALIPPVSGG